MSDQNRGTVKVVNGRYRVSGNFHYAFPNEPIRDETGKLLGVTNPADITHIHSYGGEAPFFENLSQQKLLGTKCANQNVTPISPYLYLIAFIVQIV